MSISPLELVTQALLACVVMHACGGERRVAWHGEEAMQLVFRYDNLSACQVADPRCPRSPAMRETLTIVGKSSSL